MSFVAASSSRDFWAVFAVVAVAALALVARLKFGSADVATLPPSGSPAEAGSDGEPPPADDDETDAQAAGEVPITAEGEAFIASAHEVRLVPLVDREAEDAQIPGWIRTAMAAGLVPYGSLRAFEPRSASGAPQSKPGTGLNPGDFSAARIRPGVAGAYAWRLETLGRDGDFGFFPFATEVGARAALELLEGHDIVSRPADEAGQPVPPSAEDFEEARRRYEESERDLAIEPGDDAERGNDDWSDRR